ncbi:MAG: hypothetical protein EXQ52_13250 [Bryobacterales bacterium]|nr:hypothetical protein [Bryobacterales bacterium]
MGPTGLVHYRLLDAEIKSAIDKLREKCPEVVDVSYNMREDSTGDPSLFFRIVLADEAANEDTIANTARRIRTLLYDEIRPIENWGLLAYSNFSSFSEQKLRMDPKSS